MDSIQRLLRRKVAIESLELLLKEAPYHRLHKVYQSSPPFHVWNYDDDDGKSEALF